MTWWHKSNYNNAIYASWRLILPVTRLFVQQFVQNNKRMFRITGLLVRGIWWTVDSPHRWPAMLKVFSCHDVISIGSGNKELNRVLTPHWDFYYAKKNNTLTLKRPGIKPRYSVMKSLVVITFTSVGTFHHTMMVKFAVLLGMQAVTHTSREVSKPRDSGLDYFNRSEIWPPPRQQRWWDACQISERYNNFNIHSRGFETFRYLAVRRLRA